MADKRLEIVLAAKDHSGRAFKSVSSHLVRLKKQVFSVNTALGVMAGGAALGLVIKKNLEFADTIGKTADRIGIATDALQKYRYIAERSGVAVATMDKGLEAFTKRLGEVRQGTGALNTYLGKLDENFKQQIIDAKSTDEALGLLFDRLQDTASASDRAALAAAAFSRTAGVHMTLMAKDMAVLTKRFERLGLAIDKDLIRASEQGIDAITDLNWVLKANLAKTVTALAPDIARVATNMADWVAANDGFIGQNVETAIDKVGASLKTIVSTFNALPDGVVGAAGTGIIVRMLSGSSPLGALTAALVLLNKQLEDYSLNIGSMFSSSKDLVDIVRATSEGKSWFDWKAEQTGSNTVRLPMPSAPAGDWRKMSVGAPGDTTGLGLIGQDDFLPYPEPPVEEWGTSFRGQFDDIAMDMHTAFASNFFDPMSEGFMNLEELGKSLVSAISGHLLDTFTSSMLDTIFGAAGGGGAGIFDDLGGFVAGLFHEGGVVGQTSKGRSVSPLLFAGAPRLHSGLQPDEFPAILQRGETVTPKGGTGGGNNFNIKIEAVDAASFADLTKRNPQAIVGPFVSALHRGGALRNELRGAR